MTDYNPKQIEPKWQKIWDESGTYTANLTSDKPKYIAMSMFNYPSGLGIHIGHAMNYTISDVKARFKRQQGYESYHPVGWDSFGLPAENYAIKAGISPQESMATIIPAYHKQYKAMGWSNDWEKEIATHLPEYYKWTQWVFSQMHKHGLAYQDIRLQWWCVKCQTVLANEQVIDGKCWRHDGPSDAQVQKKEVKQWFFKITDYADELLESIDALDWTDSVKLAQKNWIGKSVGAEIDFKVKDTDKTIAVFTTRADTLFGTTFLALAPEHELVETVTSTEQRAAVVKYITAAQKKTEVERQTEELKSGVFTGAYAINPANNKAIPIWIADYVLMGYGTGAIMAVPAHDQRDYEFATKFNLPIRSVIEPVLVQTTGSATFRSTEPAEDSHGVIAIVKHWSEDKYLGLKWPKAGWGTLLTGGIDEGHTPEQTVLKEIREETGFKNAKIVRSLGVIHSKYYHEPKQANRFGHAPTFYVQLQTDECEKVSEEERSKHEIHWLTLDELKNFLTATSHIQAVELLLSAVYTGSGILANSAKYDGLSPGEAAMNIVDDLTKKGLAKAKVNYKMRDWSVSRQRYWGAPIPIINCSKCGPVLVPDADLPVVLPELDDFKPSGDGRSALARAKDWLKADCPQCHQAAERETDTLDTYIDSSWYMYRYFDPHNQAAIFDAKLVKKWEPIDFYNGADHATAHLLYARFIGHFFKNLGLVNEPEPFKQFLFNGKVTAANGEMFSKSKGNGIDPLEIISSGYGADALRMYLMFAAPLDVWVKWDAQGVPGAYRFLGRLWSLVQEYNKAKPEKAVNQSAIMSAAHRTIKKVTQDIEENRYNTAIAALMSGTNELYKIKTSGFGQHPAWQKALESLIACVAPFAPHISEELWHQLGHSTSVHLDTWPKWEDKYLAQKTITVIVQVNGKLRATMTLPVETHKNDLEKLAAEQPAVKRHLDGKKVIKTIVVAGKLVNFVVKD